MTLEQRYVLLVRYQEKLNALGVKLREANRDKPPGSPYNGLRHGVSMIPKMQGFLTEGKTEKFMRWLGFLQGLFFVAGVYTLDELREHNRSPDAA